MKLFAILFLSLILSGGAAAQAVNQASIPAELLGKWSAGATSTTQFAERGGTDHSANGERTDLEFNADGTFVFATLLSVRVYGCETSIYNYNPGKFTVTGNVVNFDPTDDELIYTVSCQPSLNSDRRSPPVKASFAYTLKRIDGIETLCLSDGQDLEKCYSRDDKEKGD